MSLTKSYVKKLIAVRDAYEREQGPNDDMDKLVRHTLVALRRADVHAANWCNEQLENEKRRTALHPESLVPSGIVEPSIDWENYLRNAYGFYDTFRPSRGGPHEDNEEHPSEMMRGRPMTNPFNNRPSQLREFVPNRGGKTRTNKHKKHKKHNKGKKSQKH